MAKFSFKWTGDLVKDDPPKWFDDAIEAGTVRFLATPPRFQIITVAGDLLVYPGSIITIDDAGMIGVA